VRMEEVLRSEGKSRRIARTTSPEGKSKARIPPALQLWLMRS
jgi:hypothetical protein